MGYAGNLLIWDLPDGMPAKLASQQKLGTGVMGYCVAWSPDGKQVAVAASDNKAYVFNVP